MRHPILLSLILALTAAPLAAVDARMLRMPDVSATDIAFVYAGDVWIVPKEGGTAQRLSTPAGEESFPRFSPDGSRIAFSGNYDGNQDLYVIPAAGGLPARVTHHPAADRMLEWTPDGSELLYATAMTSEKDRFNKLYRVSAGGGLPQPLPLPYGEFGALSADGKTLAYMPHSRDFRTWKRYRGGMTSEIWLFDLEDHSWRDLTPEEANDSQPMWHGSRVYFLSDRGEHRRGNLWVHSVDTGETRQVTRFRDHDVHFPAIGPRDIVFENAGRLYLLDLESEELREVAVEVVTDRATLRPRVETVSDLIATWDVSPSARRALFEARGEVFTVPAEHGVVRNLSRSSGVAERHPAWSPDGETIAYFTDRGGEYELAVRPADGSGEEEILTALGPGFRYRLHWSPDSKKLAFVEESMKIRLYDLEARRLVEVDRGLWMYQDELDAFRFSWSADSRWLAYSRALDNVVPAVFLFDAENGERHQVTSGFYPASAPAFDPEGKYLYLLWGRSLSPIYSDLQFNWLYVNTTQVAAAALRQDVPSPLAPRNDEEGEDEEVDAKKKDDGDERDEKGGKGEKKAPDPVAIDLEGFESRLVVLPAAPGNYRDLRAAAGKVVYRRLPRTGASDGDPFDPRAGAIVYFDLEEREEKTVVEEADGYELAAGGEKLLVRQGEDYAVVDLAPEQKLEQKLAVSGLETTVDPAAEWRQIFDDAWRLSRDFFYDPGLHGVDWEGMRQRYGALLADAVTRWDVNFVIGEMIGELNASHTYRGGGDVEEPARRGVGLLGADFALERAADGGGHYRLANIIELASWESEVRSPLCQPGVEVAEGDYLLAVNGVPLDVAKDPWAAFEGLAEVPVVLTVNDRPSFDGAREVLVETLASEGRLRNLAWIEAKRRRVEEATGGRVGYVYVPDTYIPGQNELVRQFRPQFHRDGLIIDERFNSGGFGPDRMIELLNRPIGHYRAVRHGPDWQDPLIAHHGARAMLINAWAGSGGDMFPYAFRQAGLGPLIGTRTWGGVIGLSGSPALIDGGAVTVPTHGLYDLEGNWQIEGHGVDPDIEVLNDPTSMARGEDPQLERAIVEVMRMLEENPPRRPAKPAYPVVPGT